MENLVRATASESSKASDDAAEPAGAASSPVAEEASSSESGEPPQLDQTPEPEAFDFEAHRQKAIDAYNTEQGHFSDCATAVRSVVETALAAEKIVVHSIDARVKPVDSFGRKAAARSESDPTQPKYAEPLKEIMDLAGVRVITYLLDAVKQANRVIEREFDVIEKTQRTGLLEPEERLGYQSFHFLVKFSEARCALPEYGRFRNTIAEIQVRTILQHAWAEIEHDIQYKAVETIPTSIRRRFTSLAGLVEIADREFQAISDEDRQVRTDARRLVRRGALDQVEVTADALKAYLDDKLGQDGRMAEWSYIWTARLLKRMGFQNLKQIDNCIGGYNDDYVSRTLWGSRQGQLSRFEDLVLVGMGANFIRKHSWAGYQWFVDARERHLEHLKAHGVELGTYAPETDPGSSQ